jgi:hypothetical protein
VADLKTKAPIHAGRIHAAMRESAAVRTALARLRPADRAHANRAIADAIAARLRRGGWSE